MFTVAGEDGRLFVDLIFDLSKHTFRLGATVI